MRVVLKQAEGRSAQAPDGPFIGRAPARERQRRLQRVLRVGSDDAILLERSAYRRCDTAKVVAGGQSSRSLSDADP